MVMRTGVDIVYIPKIAKQRQTNGFLDRVLLPSEQHNTDPAHVAGVIAAKEAFFKALGRPIEWLEVELAYEDSGRPHFHLPTDYAQQIRDLDVSIAHDGDYAIAHVVLQVVL